MRNASKVPSQQIKTTRKFQVKEASFLKCDASRDHVY